MQQRVGYFIARPILEWRKFDCDRNDVVHMRGDNEKIETTQGGSYLCMLVRCRLPVQYLLQCAGRRGNSFYSHVSELTIVVHIQVHLYIPALVTYSNVAMLCCRMHVCVCRTAQVRVRNFMLLNLHLRTFSYVRYPFADGRKVRGIPNCANGM